MKPRVFWSGDSRIIPASIYKNSTSNNRLILPYKLFVEYLVITVKMTSVGNNTSSRDSQFRSGRRSTGDNGPSWSRQKLPRMKRSARTGAITERTKTEARQHRSSEAVKDPTDSHSNTKAVRKSRIRPARIAAPSAGGKILRPNHSQTVAISFEAKPLTNHRHQFWAPNRWETVPVVLRPNHWQTINLGFKAQPRNTRSSSPRAWCRPHTTLPDLSIARPLSTRSVRPSPVLCTRSPTPATILIAAHHAVPATCTPRDKQTWFSKRNKDKRKTKQNYPGFEFKHHQVNDSSQSNHETDHLVSHMVWARYGMVRKVAMFMVFG
jgi:hypothetical protein